MSSQKIQQPQLQGLVTYERIQQQQLQGLVAYERIQQQQLQGLVAYERINPRKDYPFLSRTEGKRRDAMSLFICLIMKKVFLSVFITNPSRLFFISFSLFTFHFLTLFLGKDCFYIIFRSLKNRLGMVYTPH